MTRSTRRLAAVSLAALALLAVIWVTTPRGGQEEAAAPVSSTTTAPPSTTTTAPLATSPAVDPSSIAPTGRFVSAPGRSKVVGRGPLHTYVVEVEAGVPLDPAAFAAAVDATLADRRGWTAAGDVALQRVGPQDRPSFRVRLATPPTVDSHCAPLRTNGIYSCRQGADVMINAMRWFEGAAESRLSLADYRHYVISHEVGHALGHGHVGCPGPGAVAPVMMQQTKGLDGCSPNPWPQPEG